MQKKTDQPDWNEMAKTFDAWVPYIQPLAERLIDRLDLMTGMKVLDVACGTGEPGLSIARVWKGDVELTGIDSAEAMVDVCKTKVKEEGLKGINHLVMRAEEIGFPDKYFDRIICRFGVMLFDDPMKGLRDMMRVLKNGGRMAFSVWSSLDKIEAAAIPFELLARQFPEDDQPTRPKMACLGDPGKLEKLLQDAGVRSYQIEPIILTYKFSDPEEFLQLVIKSGFSKEYYERLSQEKIEAWHRAIISALHQHQQDHKVYLTNEALMVIIEKDGI